VHKALARVMKPALPITCGHNNGGMSSNVFLVCGPSLKSIDMAVQPTYEHIKVATSCSGEERLTNCVSTRPWCKANFPTSLVSLMPASFLLQSLTTASVPSPSAKPGTGWLHGALSQPAQTLAAAWPLCKSLWVPQIRVR
jgi:hypothetical protein